MSVILVNARCLPEGFNEEQVVNIFTTFDDLDIFNLFNFRELELMCKGVYGRVLTGNKVDLIIRLRSYVESVEFVMCR